MNASMLMEACATNNFESISKIMKKYDYNKNYFDLYNIVKRACRKGNLNIVQYLIEQYLTDYKCDYALYVAILNGHLDVVKYLIEKCNHIPVKSNEMLKTVCKKGNLQLLKYLIENCKIKFTSHKNVIFLTAKYGHLDVIKYLIENYNFKSRQKDLNIASKNNHLHIVKYLNEEWILI